MGTVAHADDDGLSLVERVRGRRVYLDADAAIYALEGEPALKARVLPLLALIDAGEVDAVTSEMTLAEVLVVPYRTGDGGLTDQ